MIPPPAIIDGATVLRVADVSEVAPTGQTLHVVKGEEAQAFAGLAIAAYDDDPGVYLLYCDDEWRAVTDTYHETLDAAIAQAEFEFGPLTFVAVAG